MSKEIKISDILLRAAEVVISRDGEISSSNGDFACVDIGSIIHLESEISKFFDLDGDYVIRSDLPLIKARAEKYDRLIEENKRLREALKSVTTRTHVDLIRCGIGANYSGENYENKLSEIWKPYIEAQKLLSELVGE